MYTLRIFDEKKIESNHYLGNSYQVISRELSPEEHERECGGPEDVFACIIAEDGATYPLSKLGHYFIMTKTGSTFSNESYRKK